MKKLFLSISFMVGLSAALFAQKANVSQAASLTLQEKPDFKAAREAIKPAFNDEKTKNDPKTYFTAGMIGYTENDSYSKLMMLGKEVDQVKKGKAIMEAYDYFLKAYKLDQMPNAKGKVKPKFDKKIKENIKEFYTAQYNLVGYGAHLFDKKDYKGAFDAFSTFLEIPKLPMMNKELSVTDSTYRMIKYFSALAATNMQNHDKAIEMYKDLADDNYETKNVYQLLADEYRTIKDTVNYLATLEQGFKLFNDDPWFLQNIINHYIYSDKIEEASKYLDAAIAQAPTVAEYYYVKGNVDERLGNNDGARKAFEKALELQPKMASAYAGIGRIIFNQAVELLRAADSIRDNKLYNAEVQKANDIFKQSLPYMEKAVELDPKDTDFKQALKMLYYRLGDNANYEKISKELGE
ncbi:MAG: tetratricopeptide repeat protein [Paludibacteraceae bacterium]|nr:tetratricopeptide repeat protein [Paludibacteraceae bacterium]